MDSGLSPIQRLHSRATPTSDLSLPSSGVGRRVESFLIACESEEKSARTLVTYRGLLVAFVKYLTDNGLPLETAAVTVDDLRLYLLSLKERGLAPATRHHHYAVVNTFFNWLENEGLLQHNPMRKVRPPRVPEVLVQPFTAEQLRALLSLPWRTRVATLRNRAIILLFLDTGLRLKELTEIQLVDIDIDRRVITVMGKGAKQRRVRFGRVTKRAILDYVLERSDQLACLWVSVTGRRLTRDGLQGLVRKWTARAGITGQKRGAHTFRHTAAIRMLMVSKDPLAVQTMLGHSSLAMTMRYTKALAEDHMFQVHETASPVDNLGL